MITPPEKVNILIIRDNGAVRRFRIRRSLLLFLTICCLIMPLAAAGGLWLSSELWLRRQDMLRDIQTMENEYQKAKATATRLEHLETLLEKRDAARQGAVLQGLQSPEEKSVPNAEMEIPSASTTEGPGHNEFPVIDAGVVAVDNVSARLMPGNKLRVTLDVRNPEPGKVVAGSVRYLLSTEQGNTVPLESVSPHAADFRASRLKKIVLTSTLPPDLNADNAQLLIEVRTEGGEMVYRNLFPVAR